MVLRVDVILTAMSLNVTITEEPYVVKRSSNSDDLILIEKPSQTILGAKDL